MNGIRDKLIVWSGMAVGAAVSVWVVAGQWVVIFLVGMLTAALVYGALRKLGERSGEDDRTYGRMSARQARNAKSLVIFAALFCLGAAAYGSYHAMGLAARPGFLKLPSLIMFTAGLLGGLGVGLGVVARKAEAK